MGLAIIVPGADFSLKNLGQVTLADTGPEEVPIQALTINGPTSVYNEQNSAAYTITYTPDNTTQKGVIWSISGGNDLATIDQNGKLTITGTGNITIKAMSSRDNNITATLKVAIKQYIPAQPGDLDDQDLEYIGTENGNYCQTNIKFAVNQVVIFKAKLYKVENPTSTSRQFIVHDTGEFSIGNTYKENIFSVYIPARKVKTKAVLTGVVEGKITRYSTPTLSVDGTALTDLTINNSTGTGTTNILLFSNQNAAHDHERVDIYSYQMTVDDVAIINLKPAIKDKRPCFYDSVSGAYLQMEGTAPIYYATKANPNKEITFNG